MDWISILGIVAAIGFFGVVGLIIIGVVIGADEADEYLTDDDFPVQNDFGVSMDRFGYVQDARNGGAE